LDGRSKINKSVKGGGRYAVVFVCHEEVFMRELAFPVPAEYDGIRLKSFLRGYCGISSRLMIRLKREPMGITVDGLHAIVTDTLKSGTVVRLLMPDDEKQLEPVNLPISVIYEDDDVLILDKPANMPMYPTPGHDSDSLANAVSAFFLEHDEKIAFRPVYRLDKDTTGLVVLAKNPYAAARLAHSVKKEYFAVCEGELSGFGVIDSPIGLKEGHRIQRAVTPQGEKAVTKWRALGSANQHSFVALDLVTGRTHQIRVHMSNSGHPLAGDDMYGGSLTLIARQALHCGSVCFTHPFTNKELCFISELPNDMKILLNICGIKNIQK